MINTTDSDFVSHDFTDNDEFYMRRALELAQRGCGWVNPNPMVGAVIVKDGRIIGEGWHTKFGALHAEREAFAHCSEDPQGTTLYVTLEPCCHWGKTPPCTEAIIEHKISRVVMGAPDPNPLVVGKGISQLKDAGIEVTENVLLQECFDINKVFFHYIKTKRPYVVVKYAMTLDGKIATRIGASQWITGPEARQHVHQQRQRFSSILVGIGTIFFDDPLLTSRLEDEQPSRNPVRVIVDTNLRIPLESRVVQTAHEAPVLIATTSNNEQRISELKARGCDVVHIQGKKGHVDLDRLLVELGKRDIDSVYVEGGAQVHASFLEEGLADALHVYVAPKIFGGAHAPGPIGGKGVALPDEALQFNNVTSMCIGDDFFFECEVN